MNTQGIQGTTSWVQFMQLTQAARSRNSGFPAAQVSAAVASKVQSDRRVGDVYSRAVNSVSQGQVGARTSEAIKKTVGSHFDAYA